MLIKFSVGFTALYNDDTDIWSVLEGVQAAISTLVYLGLAVAFLFTVEVRLKRRRVLAAMQELRAFAHALDMHQFSKDPERLIHRELLTSDLSVDADGATLSPSHPFCPAATWTTAASCSRSPARSPSSTPATCKTASCSMP